VDIKMKKQSNTQPHEIVPRGNSFKGYYIRDSVSDTTKIFGVEPLNIFDCGQFIKDGVAYGLSFVIWFEADFPDTLGKFQESFDMSLADSDAFFASDLLKLAAAGKDIPLEALSWLPKSALSTIGQDLAEGLSPIQIFERRAGIINYRYLGKTFEEAIETRPDIVQPITDQNGVEIMNVYRCSLEE
jgi:hypothetical protein